MSISISLSLTSITSEFSGAAFSMSDIVGGGWGGGGRLFEAGHLLPFSAITDGRLFEVGPNSRFCAYMNKYGI